jgi:hypothetical protein
VVDEWHANEREETEESNERAERREWCAERVKVHRCVQTHVIGRISPILHALRSLFDASVFLCPCLCMDGSRLCTWLVLIGREGERDKMYVQVSGTERAV